MECLQSEGEHQDISTRADMERVQSDHSANQEIEGYYRQATTNRIGKKYNYPDSRPLHKSKD